MGGDIWLFSNTDEVTWPEKMITQEWHDEVMSNIERFIKEVPNTVQAEGAAWGGSPGGGLQYELPMPIKQLIEEGYIVPK